jgi:hypothetical protein
MSESPNLCRSQANVKEDFSPALEITMGETPLGRIDIYILRRRESLLQWKYAEPL